MFIVYQASDITTIHTIMKRHLLLVITASAAAFFTCAAPLTPEAALMRATDSNSQAKKLASGSRTELMFTKSIDNKAMIYMFSRGTDNGFIAVSADDMTVPLLGYSTTGTLPTSERELPDGMRYWLTTLAEQAALNSTSSTARRVRYASPERAEIAPMTKTRWNQDSPYNDKCPEISGTRCVTGCVATALAQVLRYYAYPAKGTGTHSYTWNGQDLSFDYASTAFDWDNMTDTYTDASSQTEKDAVATLMYACGVSVDMNYGTGESGAVSRNIGNALIDNFGYDKGVRFLSRDYYTITEWENIVYENLKNFGPVLYGGNNNSGGHEFVCDGYRNGYFHFNWGWGGMSDGYFLLTALDPDSQGIGGSTSGYNFDQDIISNVSSRQISDSYYQQMIWEGDFTISPLSTTKGESVDISGGFYNYSYTVLENLQIGILITPDDGGEPVFVQTANIRSLSPGYGMGNITAPAALPVGLQNGTYTVIPAFRCGEEGEATPIQTLVNAVGKYTMTVDGDNISFSSAEPATITASNFRLVSELYKGSQFKVSATLKNDSENEEYQGILVAGLIDNNEIVAIGDDMSVVLEPGQTLDWEYVSPLNYFANSEQTANIPPAGTYSLCLLEERNGGYNVITGPIEAELHDAATPTLEITAMNIEDGQYYWDMKASATLKCTQGYFAGNLRLCVFPYVTSGSVAAIGSFDSEFISISGTPSANASQSERTAATGETEVHWNFNFSNAEPGGKYFTNIYSGHTSLGGYREFTVADEVFTGTELIPAEGAEIIDREFITLTGRTVKDRRPAPGLYIVREKHADGTVTTRRAAIR